MYTPNQSEFINPFVFSYACSSSSALFLTVNEMSVARSPNWKKDRISVVPWTKYALNGKWYGEAYRTIMIEVAQMDTTKLNNNNFSWSAKVKESFRNRDRFYLQIRLIARKE